MLSLRSKLTKNLLCYFFVNPQEKLFVNELSRKLLLDKRNLVKKLKELEKEGILISNKQGNLKIYSLNTRYALYNEYRNIIFKTSGLEIELKKVISKVKGIKEIYIYGSYAANNLDVHSDIDLLVVGNHDIVALQNRLNRIQEALGREINTVNMSTTDFNKRVKNKDHFITGILTNKHIKISA